MTTATPDSDFPSSSNGSDADDSLGTQAQIETAGPCRLRIKAEVPADKVTELLDRNYRELISSLQLPGFRRGRVPRALVEKRYGEEVEKELKDVILNDSFLEIVKENDLKVVGSPDFGDVTFEKNEPFVYDFEVEVRPEFELGDYKGIEVERESMPVTEEDVQKQLEMLQRDSGQLVPGELADATKEDYLEVGIEVQKDGETVYEVPNTMLQPGDDEVLTISVENLLDRLKQADSEGKVRIEGVEAGEDFIYDEKLQGETVDLAIEVREVKRIQLPEIDDELAKKYEAESVDDLRSKIREHLAERNRRLEQRKVEDAVVDKLVEAHEFEVPEGVFEQQRDAYKMRIQYGFLQQGRSKDEIEKELEKADSEEDAELIRKEIKSFFILDRIAEKEKVFATEDDLQERIVAMASQMGRSAPEVLQELRQSGRLEDLRNEIRHQKVRELLGKRARVKDEGGADAGDATDGAAANSEAAANESSGETSPGDEAAGAGAPPDESRAESTSPRDA